MAASGSGCVAPQVVEISSGESGRVVSWSLLSERLTIDVIYTEVKDDDLLGAPQS